MLKKITCNFPKLSTSFSPGTGNKNKKQRPSPPSLRSNMIRQEAEDEAAAEEDGFVGDDEAIANLFMASQPIPPLTKPLRNKGFNIPVALRPPKQQCGNISFLLGTGSVA